MIDEYLMPDACYDRLVKDWGKWGTLCVAYDFDGTVSPFHNLDATYHMVIQLIKDLKSIGCETVCWTANPDHVFVKEYLEKHGIPCDGINTHGIYLGYESKKPFFSALLDDRSGIRSMYEDLTRLVQYVRENHIGPPQNKENESTEKTSDS